MHLKHFATTKTFSMISILLANVVTFAWVIFEGFDLYLAVMIYWIQSIAIGVVFLIRMIAMKKFSIDGFSLGDTPLEPTTGTKWLIVCLFVVEYLFYLFVYYKFIIVGEIQRTLAHESMPVKTIVFLGGLFFISHFMNYLMNRTPDDVYEPNIGVFLFYPMARVFPLQIFLFAIMFGKYSFIVFGLIKIGIDVLLEKHAVERYW